MRFRRSTSSGYQRPDRLRPDWLWVGTALADQIALAWLPALLRVLDADPERLSLVQFHKSERGTEILGLGMLNPKQLAAHPPPTSLTKADLTELTQRGAR